MDEKLVSRYFKVLSNPIRLKVFLKILDESCECDLGNKEKVSGNCVTHISNSLHIPQPTVSNHVKELISSGIIQSKRRGKNIFLFGSKDFLKNFAEFTNQVRKKY